MAPCIGFKSSKYFRQEYESIPSVFLRTESAERDFKYQELQAGFSSCRRSSRKSIDESRTKIAFVYTEIRGVVRAIHCLGRYAGPY